MSVYNQTKIKFHVNEEGGILIHHYNDLYILLQEGSKFRVTWSPQGEQVWNSLAEFLTALENQDFHDGIQAAK